MNPLWQLCADSAYLNSTALQHVRPCAGVESQSAYGLPDCTQTTTHHPFRQRLARPAYSEPENPSCSCDKRLRIPGIFDQRDKKRLGMNWTAAGKTRSSPNQRTRKDTNNCRTSPKVRFLTDQKIQGHARELKREIRLPQEQDLKTIRTEKDANSGKSVGKNEEYSNHGGSPCRRKTRIEVCNPIAASNAEFTNTKLKFSQNYGCNTHQHGQNVDKNGRSRQDTRQARESSRALPAVATAQQDGGCPDIRPSRRRRRHTGHGSRATMRARRNQDKQTTPQDLLPSQGRDQSSNKGKNQEEDPNDVSNNRWLPFFSKKEDPRKTEERFYGGQGSPRLLRMEGYESAGHSKLHAFQSPASASNYPAPHLGVYGQQPWRDANVLGVSTNDAGLAERLRMHGRPPYGTFRTVSVLLDSPKQQREAKGPPPVYVATHDVLPLATRLQPYVPFDTVQPVVRSGSGRRRRRLTWDSGSDTHTMRLPPLQFKPNLEKDARGPLPEPFQHPGIAWPLAFASNPPYSAPGHEAAGVKQPVGVLQTGIVPARPQRARAWDMDTDIPAWISPLYKTYGIGGPYGRHGPFVEPCLLAQDGRWDNVLRQAEALGALKIPGVITDSGRLELAGLCGDYMRLKREEQARLGRWRCRTCTSVRNFFGNVKRKLRFNWRKIAGSGVHQGVGEGHLEQRRGQELDGGGQPLGGELLGSLSGAPTTVGPDYEAPIPGDGIGVAGGGVDDFVDDQLDGNAELVDQENG